MKNNYINIEIKEGKINYIDYLKSFSILMIVDMHLIQIYMTFIPSKIKLAASFLGAGVHVFFFLSAMGLYLSYIKKEQSYTDFVKNRFLKIYIPYIIIIIISFFIPIMYDGNDRLIALMSHIFCFKMLSNKYTVSFGEQFWFISTIMQFYLLFVPLCKFKKKIGNKKFIVLSFIISIMWQFFLSKFNINDRVLGSFFLQYLWEFSLGMITAEFIYKRKIIKIGYKKLLLLFLISIIYYIFFSIINLKAFNDYGAFLSFLIIGIVASSFKYSRKAMVLCAKHSYELFLIHILIFNILFYYIKCSNLFEQLILGVVAIILSIILSYLFSWILSLFKKIKR